MMDADTRRCFQYLDRIATALETLADLKKEETTAVCKPERDFAAWTPDANGIKKDENPFEGYPVIILDESVRFFSRRSTYDRCILRLVNALLSGARVESAVHDISEITFYFKAPPLYPPTLVAHIRYKFGVDKRDEYYRFPKINIPIEIFDKPEDNSPENLQTIEPIVDIWDSRGIQNG